MPESDFVQTGIAGFDDILSGGIPRGNVILVEGAIGCGKTTMGVEFIYRGAQRVRRTGHHRRCSRSRRRRLSGMRGGSAGTCANWNKRGELRIVFTTREVLRQELQQADSVLLEEATKIGARRIFVDGIARLIGSNGTPETRSGFHVFTEGLQRENLTACWRLKRPLTRTGHSASLPEESIADTVIRLRMEENDRAVSRSLEIVKSRGQYYQMGRHTIQIIDGQGLHVYRRVQAPRGRKRDRAAAYDPTTRVSTGIPGLDELTNGGYFLGSTTVVAGISGVGKSVMGLQYLAEGARRGERCLMLSLDEQVEQIIRNAASIGIDLRAEMNRGLIRVEYEPPQEIEVDVHFHHIERLVQEFKPTAGGDRQPVHLWVEPGHGGEDSFEIFFTAWWPS